jgi:alanyl-tRNA synthetase
MSKSAAASVRREFLDYFARHGHTVVKSSSLLPANDPTLMFTNAGMVQFKDVFVGAEKRPYTRATTSQKCMRVSGKHNDLEEVGRTARHHTFFEMLGNFSFGDYFKEEAIGLAWRFVTQEVGLDPARLWVTVFGGEGGLPADREARELWLRISGLPEARILDKGMKDNFWAMGDTGPCGPCTEIHYDQEAQGTPSAEDFENGRVIEIWNNVFMQFERKPGGELVPLPKPSVDTGMGLERLTAVLQGETSNYHTDLFAPILQAIAAATGKPYRRGDGEDDVSMRVIADHARATAFLVADGLQPSNEGRGYVLRRIMRRAIRHGKRLGLDDLFFHVACDAVVATMAEAFPELAEARSLIGKVAENEEKSFRRTLEAGLRRLAADVAATHKNGERVLAGSAVFRLYDTYGFPKDLTEVIAREQGLAIDAAGFDAAMAAQQERSRGSEVGEAAVAAIYKDLAGRLGAVEFVGYPHEDAALEARPGRWRRRRAGGTETLELETTVAAILSAGREVEASDGAAEVEVVLTPTPFYGESGGQVGDRGVIVADGLTLEVCDSQKPVEGLTLSRCRVLEGTIRRGEPVWAGYDVEVRKQTRAHHSATHLLHGALRRVLGDHVKQQGSLVDPERLRFDYAHFEAPTAAQLGAIERDVDERIHCDDPVVTEVLPFDQAKQQGAIALFGEKYGDVVRMVRMGPSVELCGGTHAHRTRDIDLLLIVGEEAVASGIRRIEAEVSRAARARTERTAAWLARVAQILAEGESAAGDDNPILQAVRKHVRQGAQLRQELAAIGVEALPPPIAVTAPVLGADYGLDEAARLRDLWQGLTQMVNARGAEVEGIAERLSGADSGNLLKRYAAIVRQNREHERLLEQRQAAKFAAAAGSLSDTARFVGGVKLVTTRVDGADAKALRELADQIRDRMQSGVLCLGGESDGKASLVVVVTKDLTARFQAGKLVQELAPLIGGKGGGKPEMAQAGGGNPAGLGKVFSRIAEILNAKP